MRTLLLTDMTDRLAWLAWHEGAEFCGEVISSIQRLKGAEQIPYHPVSALPVGLIDLGTQTIILTPRTEITTVYLLSCKTMALLAENGPAVLCTFCYH